MISRKGGISKGSLYIPGGVLMGKPMLTTDLTMVNKIIYGNKIIFFYGLANSWKSAFTLGYRILKK